MFLAAGTWNVSRRGRSTRTASPGAKPHAVRYFDRRSSAHARGRRPPRAGLLLRRARPELLAAPPPELAHALQRRVGSGEFADYANMARSFGLTRARATQIMDLLLLAADIQEEILTYTLRMSRAMRGLWNAPQRFARRSERQSSSLEFRKIVNITLSRSDRFKRVEPGRDTAR